MDIYLTDEQRDTLNEWLHESGYPTVEDWARDSDYVQNLRSGEWYADGPDDQPWAAPVDIEVQAWLAMEAEAEALAEEQQAQKYEAPGPGYAER